MFWWVHTTNWSTMWLSNRCIPCVIWSLPLRLVPPAGGKQGGEVVGGKDVSLRDAHEGGACSWTSARHVTQGPARRD
jgi:hypothetical protein